MPTLVVSTTRSIPQLQIDTSFNARQLILDTFLMALEEVRKEAPRGSLHISLSVEKESVTAYIPKEKE